MFESSTPHKVSFLTEQYNKGASYDTIHKQRPALSLLIGNNLTTDESVKRLLKGIFKMRLLCPSAQVPGILSFKLCFGMGAYSQ